MLANLIHLPGAWHLLRPAWMLANQTPQPGARHLCQPPNPVPGTFASPPTRCQAPLLFRVGMLVNPVQSPGARHRPKTPGTGLRRGKMLANSGPSTKPFVPGTDCRGRFAGFGSVQSDGSDRLLERAEGAFGGTLGVWQREDFSAEKSAVADLAKSIDQRLDR
jgi:hypothetical protein